MLRSEDLYLRFNEHLSGKNSNRALQFAILKYGLDNFDFGVYEFFTCDNKASSLKLLTDIETIYINKFDFNTLYNFSKSGSSIEGYKHTEAAKLKMVERYKDKSNLWGKHHDEITKSLISKPGLLNSSNKHSEQTRELIRSKKKKYLNGVGIYDLNDNLEKSFDYASDLAIYLNVSKVTVSKYINKGLVFKGKYYLKVNPFK